MDQQYLTKSEFMLGLAEFTETALLPAAERIVGDKVEEKPEEKFERLSSELKCHIDNKLKMHLAATISVFRGESRS
ncbi:hypothetical protein KKC32_00410 [Patescibacteria group bacterium]|nr:hypothetical protein [Patescibacteria group bacterium]